MIKQSLDVDGPYCLIDYFDDDGDGFAVLTYHSTSDLPSECMPPDNNTIITDGEVVQRIYSHQEPYTQVFENLVVGASYIIVLRSPNTPLPERIYVKDGTELDAVTKKIREVVK